MEKEILITNCNRDAAKLWFEQVDGDIYTIKASKDYVLEYACINFESLSDDADDYDTIFETDNQIEGHKSQKALIYSFDPSGGPYIGIGDNINGYIVSRIFFKDNKGPVLFRLKK